MKSIFTRLMIKLPITLNALFMTFISILLFYFFNGDENYINIDFRWFFAAAGVTSALLAQIYFKLHDMKSIANASPTELNRITDRVKEYSSPIIKLIFFHLFFATASNIAFSLNLIPVADAIVTSIALSCIPLWGLGLFFGYSVYDEITNFHSDLLKRHLERVSRKESLRALEKKTS